jgi:hypothetical protein
MGFLGLNLCEEVRRHAETKIEDRNISKWKKEIANEDIESLMAIIEPTLRALDYNV